MNLNEFKNILIENYNNKVKNQIFVDKFDETIYLQIIYKIHTTLFISYDFVIDKE